MALPVQLTQPLGVWPQWSKPLVKVGVLLDLRQKARPLVVRWWTSPVPPGSANSQVTGSPIASPIWALRSANPNTKRGGCPAGQLGASCAAAVAGAKAT